MERIVLFLVLTFLKTTVGSTCLSCSYTLSSDPSVGYECATAQNSSTSRTVACGSCYTRATYQPSLQVRSVSRGCLESSLCTGDLCCDKNGPYTTCEHKCTGDTCNGLNVESWPRDSDANTGTPASSPGLWTVIVAVITGLALIKHDCTSV